MSRQQQLAVTQRVRKSARVRQSPEESLRRFSRKIRKTVRCLAARHPRLTDLALSFPGLLVALAVPRLGFDPRPAVAAVIAGQPLAEIAALAQLPMWVRKLPPEAFSGPVPDLPGNDVFARRVSNCIPKSRRLAATWLSNVAISVMMCHEPFALWIAALKPEEHLKLSDCPLTLLAVWAWYSLHPEELAGQLDSANWSPGLAIGRAMCLARIWLAELEVAGAEAVAGKPREMLTASQFGGYDFVPLNTSALLREEAKAMENCIADSFLDSVRGDCELWSLRKNGERVASFKLSTAAGDHFLAVGEVQGRANTPVSLEVARIIRQWLLAWGEDRLVRDCRGKTCIAEANVLRFLLKPYRVSNPMFRLWLPLHIEAYDLNHAFPHRLLR